MQKKKEKANIIHFLLCIALAATIFSTSMIPALPVSAETVSIKGTYHQTEARKMKAKINAFRTGSEAWYYAEGSDQKISVPGLGKLSYDYKLEKIAMKRAAELYVSFSHTRPNGSDCFSLYPDGYTSMGENIAMGTSSIMSMEQTLDLWKETDEPYEGQGHRRNMLSPNFTSVGIACFEVNGERYWVQEFGSPNSSLAKTKAVDSKRTVKVKK